MDINKEIARIEAETGKFVGSFQLGKTGPENVELLPYRPSDLVLDVWNMKVRLLQAIRAGTKGCVAID